MGYHDIFAELGLLEEPVQANPLDTLGISRDLASELLTGDPSGQTLQIVVGGLRKSLMQVYHPDRETGDQQKFIDIQDASGRIISASGSSLSRWTQRESHNYPQALRDAAAKEASTVQNASTIFEALIELDDNPLHFRNFDISAGVLLRKKSNTYLMRSSGDASELLAGKTVTNSDNWVNLHTKQAHDFKDFLSKNDYFGQDPTETISVFTDEANNLQVYNSNFEYVTEAGDQLVKLREDYKGASPKEQRDTAIAKLWLRSNHPELISLKSSPLSPIAQGEYQTISFERRDGPGRTMIPGWDLPFGVIGTVSESVANSKKFRARNNAGRAALLGVQSGVPQQFSFLPLPFSNMLTHETEYSPLLIPGQSLLLHDTNNKLPLATELVVMRLLAKKSK